MTGFGNLFHKLPCLHAWYLSPKTLFWQSVYVECSQFENIFNWCWHRSVDIWTCFTRKESYCPLLKWQKSVAKVGGKSQEFLLPSTQFYVIPPHRSHLCSIFVSFPPQTNRHRSIAICFTCLILQYSIVEYGILWEEFLGADLEFYSSHGGPCRYFHFHFQHARCFRWRNWNYKWSRENPTWVCCTSCFLCKKKKWLFSVQFQFHCLSRSWKLGQRGALLACSTL